MSDVATPTKAAAKKPAAKVDTITIAAVVKEQDAVSERTSAEMELGKQRIAFHADRIAKMEVEEAKATELVARDNTLVPGFSTPGQPVPAA